jgi:hypothetical protein
MDLNIKCLPFNSRGAVALAAVVAVAITTEGRAGNPYPPGKVQVNGEYWPTLVEGDATLTWAHRNRFTLRELGRVVQQDEASQGAVEGTYRIEVLLDGVVEAGRTQENLTGTSFVYTFAQYQVDDPTETALVSFRLTSVNGARAGRARTTDEFMMGAGS